MKTAFIQMERTGSQWRIVIYEVNLYIIHYIISCFTTLYTYYTTLYTYYTTLYTYYTTLYTYYTTLYTYYTTLYTYYFANKCWHLQLMRITIILISIDTKLLITIGRKLHTDSLLTSCLIFIVYFRDQLNSTRLPELPRRKKQVMYSMALENVELMHNFLSKL